MLWSHSVVLNVQPQDSRPVVITARCGPALLENRFFQAISITAPGWLADSGAKEKEVTEDLPTLQTHRWHLLGVGSVLVPMQHFCFYC